MTRCVSAAALAWLCLLTAARASFAADEAMLIFFRHAVVAEHADLRCQLIIICRHASTFAIGSEILSRIETEGRCAC